MKSIPKLGQQLVVVSVLATTGCVSTFEETHYFRVREAAATKATNYFKVHVSGFTLLSSTRYLSGYFDEAAVDAYFNEISQPPKGEFIKQVGNTAAAKPLDPSLEGRSLVMILSTNSDEIATQIGALAENERTAKALSRLINRDRILAATQSRGALNSQKVNAQILSNLGDRLFTDIDVASMQRQDVIRRIIEYANALAATLGKDSPATSLDDMAGWLATHRNQLMQQ